MTDRWVGGTIRRVSLADWDVIADSDHAPRGISNVSVVTGALGKCIRVTYDFIAVKVVTSHVTLDERFASYTYGQDGIRVGQSVGLKFMDIYIYEAASMTPVNPGLYSMAGANLWVSGLFEVA